MNKERLLKVLPSVLFGVGTIGIFVSEVLTAKNTIKAKEILERHDAPVRYESATIVGFDEEKNLPIFDNIVEKPKHKYYAEVVKATWKCYIPAIVATAATLVCLITSKMLDARSISMLSTAAMGSAGLVAMYRDKIREYANEDILREIDSDIANNLIERAHPPVVSSAGNAVTVGEHLDLKDDKEYIFFDPFTKMKFRSTKLAVLGAKYYLNRNFSLGGNVPLSMFYAFLGLALPEEYNYCEWDVDLMCDSGYYWIDIDIVRSTRPDPDTGEEYYILEYAFDPGEVEENFYPYGNPTNSQGSFAT